LLTPEDCFGIALQLWFDPFVLSQLWIDCWAKRSSRCWDMIIAVRKAVLVHQWNRPWLRCEIWIDLWNLIQTFSQNLRTRKNLFSLTRKDQKFT
jgi:hypothetical protein